MNSRHLRVLRLYHICFLSIFFIAFVLGLRYLDSIDLGTASSLFELSGELENLEKKDFIGDIRKFVIGDRVRESLSNLEDLGDRIGNINKVATSKEYEQFKEEESKVKSSLLKLISFPDLSSIFFVLNTKTNEFKDYASSNQWRRLTAISRSLSKKIGSFKALNLQTIKQLEKLYLDINRSIHNMENITRRSILSLEKKSNIIQSLSRYSKEIVMIKGYIVELKNFEQHHTNLKKIYDAWYKSVLPTIVEKKLNLERKSYNVFLLGACLLFFLSVNFLFIFPLHRWIEKKSLASYEKRILNILQQSIIPFDGKIPSMYSRYFQMEIAKIKRYLHKRMSYGAIFQEATPFSALLLDSNLKVIWANDLFYKTWNLEHKNLNNDLSWDYLQKHTNLGEDDPIHLALKSTVAGIYNIQIKPKGVHESLPYEMYVSPVQYLGQKRIMLFLYPLRSMEETLNDQTKSITGPVMRTLDAFIENNYTDEFSNKIKKDFEVANIEHIYGKFLEYRQSVEKGKNAFVEEAKRLKDKAADAYKTLDDINEFKYLCERENRSALYLLSDMKELFIRSVDRNDVLVKKLEHIRFKFSSVWKEQEILLEICSGMDTVLKEKSHAFSIVLNFRKEFKEAKKGLDSFRQDFIHIVDKVLVDSRKLKYPSSTANEYQEMKNEARKIGDILNTLSDASVKLDIALSKIEMVVEEFKTPNFLRTQEVFDGIRRSIESDICTIDNVCSETVDKEVADKLQDIFDRLHKVYDSFKKIDVLTGVHRMRNRKNTPSVSREFRV